MNPKQEKRYRKYLKRKKQPKKGKKFKIVKEKKKVDYEAWAIKCSNDEKKKSNRLERDIMIMLDELDISYEYQKPFVNGNQFYVVDFYLTDHNIAIECDGSYHDTDKAKERDRYRTDWLKANTEMVDLVRIHYTQFFNDKKEQSTLELISYLERLENI